MIPRSSILTALILLCVKAIVIISYSSIVPRSSSKWFISSSTSYSSKCYHPIRTTATTTTIRNTKHYLYSDTASDGFISTDNSSNGDNANNPKLEISATNTEEDHEQILLHLCSTLFNLTSIPNIRDASYWNQVIRHIPYQNKNKKHTIQLEKYNTTQYALSILWYFKRRKIPASIFTYNSILNVMAFYGDGKNAQMLLKSMEDGMEDVYPDIISYNTVINAWKKSNVPDSVLQCEEILTQLLFSNSTTTSTTPQKPVSRSGKKKRKRNK